MIFPHTITSMFCSVKELNGKKNIFSIFNLELQRNFSNDLSCTKPLISLCEGTSQTATHYLLFYVLFIPLYDLMHKRITSNLINLTCNFNFLYLGVFFCCCCIK